MKRKSKEPQWIVENYHLNICLVLGLCGCVHLAASLRIGHAFLWTKSKLGTSRTSLGRGRARPQAKGASSLTTLLLGNLALGLLTERQPPEKHGASGKLGKTDFSSWLTLPESLPRLPDTLYISPKTSLWPIWLALPTSHSPVLITWLASCTSLLSFPWACHSPSHYEAHTPSIAPCPPSYTWYLQYVFNEVGSSGVCLPTSSLSFSLPLSCIYDLWFVWVLSPSLVCSSTGRHRSPQGQRCAWLIKHEPGLFPKKQQWTREWPESHLAASKTRG